MAAVSLLGLAAAVAYTAWICDDALITLRTAENWVAGHGPTWNVAERAQTHTHPLWLLVLTGGRALTGEAYFTTIGLGGALSLLAAALLMALARSPLAIATIGVLLLGSRSYVEYSTSGLENPLSFALLALLALHMAGGAPPPRRLGVVALLSGLLVLARMDLAILVTPPLLAALRGVPWRGALLRLALGLAPLAAWVVFATLYYGTPFSVIAHAKLLSHGIPAGELVRQGAHYLDLSARSDPVAAGAIGTALVAGVALPRSGLRPLALGGLCYCLYVVWIGGDFMIGRLLTPPFVVAAAVIAHALAPLRGRSQGLAIAGVLALTLLGGVPVWLRAPERQAEHAPIHGIADERSYFSSQFGLLSRDRAVPRAGAFSETLRGHGRTAPVLALHGAYAGRLGYEGGDLLHIVDPWLCDPLLARLPVEDRTNWRVGHFTRRVPEGYLETLATGENRIHHAGLRRYCDALRTITRRRVLDADRLHELWRFWRGEYDAGLAAYVAEEYRAPPRITLAAETVCEQIGPNALWYDDPRIKVVYRGGLAVRFARAGTARSIDVSLQPYVRYVLRLRNGGADVWSATLDAVDAGSAIDDPKVLNGYLPLYRMSVELPARVGAFDTIWIDVPALSPFRVACLGALRVVR